jgi:hypothetical protein
MSFQRLRFQRQLLRSAVLLVGDSVEWDANAYTCMLKRMIFDGDGPLGTSSDPFVAWTSHGQMWPVMEALPQMLKICASHPANYLTSRECAWQCLNVANWKDYRTDVFAQLGENTRDIADVILEYSHGRDSRRIKARGITTFPGMRDCHISNYARQHQRHSHESILGIGYKEQRADMVGEENEENVRSDSTKGEAQLWSDRFIDPDSKLRPLIEEIADELVRPSVEAGSSLSSIDDNEVVSDLLAWYDLKDKRYEDDAEDTLTSLIKFLKQQKKKECGTSDDDDDGDDNQLPRDAFTHLMCLQKANELKKVLQVAQPSMKGVGKKKVDDVRLLLVDAFSRTEGPNQVSVDDAKEAFRQVFAQAKEKFKDQKSAMCDLVDVEFDEEASGVKEKSRNFAEILADRPRGEDAKRLFDYEWDESKSFPFRRS